MFSWCEGGISYPKPKHGSVGVIHFNSQQLFTKGCIQNMDPRSMDHHCGPGPWTPLWTTPHFVQFQAEKSLDEKEKSSWHLSGQFKQKLLSLTET